MTEPARPLVSRAGEKLRHALDEFNLDPAGLRCADLGCNVGGFTDCLLRRGAASVVAIDTGYGVLDWRLRNDERVTVMERTNALHADGPDGPVDLVTVDLGWTPQRHALRAARGFLESTGRIISLVKPHYELTDAQRREHLVDGRLDDAIAQTMLEQVLEGLTALGLEPMRTTVSPLRGGKSGRRAAPGNREFLLLAKVSESPSTTA